MINFSNKFKDATICSCGSLIKISLLVKISHLPDGKKYNVFKFEKENIDFSIFCLNDKKSWELNSPKMYGSNSLLLLSSINLPLAPTRYWLLLETRAINLVGLISILSVDG